MKTLRCSPEGKQLEELKRTGKITALLRIGTHIFKLFPFVLVLNQYKR